MELLIPGLILVALMVWASTKIKKRAADAFESELIETDRYSLLKPEGFLHVIGDPDHELAAYSREFGENDKLGIRRATIELDVLPASDFETECESLRRIAKSADAVLENDAGDQTCRIKIEETANEITVDAVYKIVGARDAIYKLRFAVLPEHADEYLGRIDLALDNFIVRTR